MKEKEKTGKRKEYIRGFTLALVILIAGILLEWVSEGNGMSLPAWPMNLFIGISFAFCIAFVHFFYRDINYVKWLSRVPASISSIALFTLLTLILGLTKQNNPDAPEILKLTGLNHVRNSFTFLLSGLYLLTTLGLVILRRATKFNYRNIGFLLNHLGLWIIVLAGSLGAGDLSRLQVYANENEAVWYGYEKGQKIRELPFTLKLIDFNIEFYNSKLAYIQSDAMKLAEGVENNLTMMEAGLKIETAGWEVKIEDYIQEAKIDSNAYYEAPGDTLAFPLAKISAIHTSTGKEIQGIISAGGIMQRPIFLKANERFSFAMTQPEPREYSSLLEIMSSSGDIDTSLLKVNEPIKVDGWNLYQLSYDERKGKWSELSVIEAINDPWLPVIYLGIFMVIAGALYLFTIGKKPKEE
jgi:hypothetical protein